MNMRAEVNFPEIAPDVARALLGEPNPALSSATELRFGTHGSLSIDLKRAVWHDHETGTGGGLLALIARETGLTNGKAFDWLREKGFAPRQEPRAGTRPKLVATYAYRDEDGRLLFEVCRFHPKGFRQRAPDGRGGWSWRLDGVRRVLYRLPELAASPRDLPVYVVEGEKDADRLAGLGFVATTCPGGAGKWRGDYAAALRERRVVILPDNDDPGRSHAAAVLNSLRSSGVHAAVLTLDGLPRKGDVVDWLDAGGRPEDLARTAEGALGEPPPERRMSAFISAADLAQRPVPPREWLVTDLIPSGTVTMLGGDGGTGKSLLALQLACAAALGRPWLGRGVAPGRALFFSAEDDMDELHRRLADITCAEGVSLADLDSLTIRSLAGEDALLATLSRATGGMVTTPLYDDLDARLGDEKPAVAVLDTLADLHAGDENQRAHARQIVGLLRGLAIRHGCAVVVLAHPSLTGMGSGSGLSGSTAWNGSVRSRLYLERITQDSYESDPDARRLSTKKANYGRTGGEIAMKWRGGVFVADAVETGLERMASGAKAERVFLKLLGLFHEQGRTVNHAGGQTYAPSIFAEHPDAEGCTKRAFKAAMEALLSNGRIVVSEEGPPSKRRQYLAVAEAK